MPDTEEAIEILVNVGEKESTRRETDDTVKAINEGCRRRGLTNKLLI